jgi:hypothetical protein
MIYPSLSKPTKSNPRMRCLVFQLTIVILATSCSGNRLPPSTTSLATDVTILTSTTQQIASSSSIPTPNTIVSETTTTTCTIDLSSGEVLGDKALTLEPSVHGPAIYVNMCLTCHGEGTGIQQYPLAGLWSGTPKNPGPWIVIKGSQADHTGRTDWFACTNQKGCHNKTGF